MSLNNNINILVLVVNEHLTIMNEHMHSVAVVYDIIKKKCLKGGFFDVE